MDFSDFFAQYGNCSESAKKAAGSFGMVDFILSQVHLQLNQGLVGSKCYSIEGINCTTPKWK